MKIYVKTWAGTAIACSLAFLTILSSCDDNDDKDDSPAANIKVTSNASLGTILTDKSGKSLYYFTRDVKGSSACTSEQCLAAWPVFYEEKLVLDKGLDTKDFATITRTDGQKQTTFKGWPLYYYAQDAAAGETKGENVGKVWYVAKPDYSLLLADQGTRKYLTTLDGKTLYLFTNDTNNNSACTGDCLKAWPVFYMDKNTVPSLVPSSDFGTITRSDGAKQTTYKGIPLYFYASDVARGDTLGGGVNKKWYTVTP
jgi:predicted lipoprotein with Yx(FWY)xxD motif